MVNPPYYVWPALRHLERLVPGRSWRRLSTDGLPLSAAARFGRWGLPADWIDLPHDPAGPRPVPAWVDLASGQVAPYPGHGGVQAVVALTRAAVSRGRVQPLFPRLASRGSYDEAALILLSRLAWREGVVDPPLVEAAPSGPTAAQRMIRVFRKLGRGLP